MARPWKVNKRISKKRQTDTRAAKKRNAPKRESASPPMGKYYLPKYEEIIAALELLSEGQASEDLIAMGIDVSKFKRVDSRHSSPPAPAAASPKKTGGQTCRDAKEKRELFSLYPKILGNTDLDSMSDVAGALNEHYINALASSERHKA